MLTHYSKKLIFTLLACAPLSAYADVVSTDSALQLAAEFFNACGHEELASEDALELVYTCSASSRPLYYVFNAKEGQGFVIVSGDDCTSSPVLGYSVENRFDPASVPPAMKWMMQGLESEIKAAPALQRPVARDERRRMARRVASGNERILLKTPEWRQEYPFNSMIPGNPLTGCVGTAMAMIMKYHNYPERGTGSYNGVNFDVAYDWDNMRMDNYRYGYSQAEADAVGTLVYHTAVSIGTQFGYSGSSAYEVKVPAALTNYFGYDPGVSYKKRSETATQAEFDALVENDIRAGRPVLYCGQDVTSGHAFVVDGYDPLSRMIHINWGWGGADGNNNGGWYASTALNPTVSQQHSFNNLTTIIYNIKPGNGNNTAWSPIHITADGRQVGMSSNLEGDLTAGQSFTVRVGNLKNVSYNDFSGKIAVALFGSDGSFKATLSRPDGFSLKGMGLFSLSYADFQCQLSGDVAVAEGDMIRVATSADGGTTWLPVPGELVTVNEIPAKGAVPQRFSITHTTPLTGATFTGESSVIRGWNYRFKVVPDNPGRDVVTVKANGYVLTPDASYNYALGNVLADQRIDIYVQDASEVREKRSIWVSEPGTLESLLEGADAATVKDLTLFGRIDARDFAFMRRGMKLTRLDLSGVSVAAYGSDQANAIPREAFLGVWSLGEVILPSNITRLNNGAFRSCGIKRIVIPASVTTYEYNVFNGSWGLLDIWVGNPNPAYINWCVLHGTPLSRMTLHCPSEAAVTRYKAKEYWADVANVVVDPIKQPTDFAFAVMEDAEVKYVADTEPGRYEKGRKVVFTAEHIVDNDNRMDVYANSTLLKPDASGKYTAVINGNTIVHFDLVEPMTVSNYESPWTLTDDGGAIGLLTDAVNVLPGVPFTIRVNTFAVTDNAFWAAVLTTADGHIKEFISPIGNWSAGPGKGLRMNVDCCVSDATVREGNMIRLATSYNKKTWVLVKGVNGNVVDALPALNNQTPLYNFTFPEDLAEKANLSGIVTSAVRGRDLTFKITPKSAADVITMLVNGKPYAQNAKSVTYSFIAKENLDFDVRVTTPNIVDEVVFDLKPGERLWDNSNTTLRRERLNALKPKVVVKGNIDYTDLGLFRHTTAQGKVVSLDLSGAKIVADRSAPGSYKEDEFPSFAFCPSSSIGTTKIVLKDLRFPPEIKVIQANSLYNCSQITELELPLNLYNNAQVNGIYHIGGLKQDCFKGCDNLTTIYCYATPAGGNVDMVHHIDFNGPYGGSNNPEWYPNTLGLTNPSKVTVVVKPEYWSQYSTPKYTGTGGWINGWKYGNFNMVYDYPVYGVNFDVTRCFVSDTKADITRLVSFLGDDCVLGSQDLNGMLYVAALSRTTTGRPAGADAYDASRQVRVYDNGQLVSPSRIASDGSVKLTFYNPNNISRKNLCGDHNIDVVYLYDVTFSTPSSNMVIVPAEIRNDESAGASATHFETFDYYNAVAPVLRSVRENNSVRFRVRLDNVMADQVVPVVKIGETVLSPDAEGYYSVDVIDSDVAVNVYAVPVDGATLNTAEVGIINASEAKSVTSIALAGDIAPEKVKELIDEFPVLERLDLSELTVALPQGAMEGNETLKTVVLPDASDIEASTFRGCTALSSVIVPECVDYIGESAFEGCTSLQTLNFSGIRGVGANAFSGCTSLTSVIFTASRPDSQPARIRRRSAAPRAESYDADAFAGLNPNCIVYLDETVPTPDAKANYVRVRQDLSAEGGRVYEALGSIELDPAYSFQALNAFRLTDGNSMSMQLSLAETTGSDNWSPLVLPFTPTMVTDATGAALMPFTGGASATDGAGMYVAATFGSARSGKLMLMPGIEANTPYVVALQKGTPAGVTRFVGVACEVPRTPAEIRVQGDECDLAATFAGNSSLPAATTGMLDDGGTAFVTGDPEDGAAVAAPFSVYTVGQSGSRYEIDLDTDPSIPTGVIVGDADADGFTVVREGSAIVIYAPRTATVAVYDLSGRIVLTAELSQGRNVVGGLLPGVYFLLGRKVVI